MKCLINGATRGQENGLGPHVAALLAERAHEVYGLCHSRKKAEEEKRYRVEALSLSTVSGQKRFKVLLRDFNSDVIWPACGSGGDVPRTPWGSSLKCRYREQANG